MKVISFIRVIYSQSDSSHNENGQNTELRELNFEQNSLPEKSNNFERPVKQYPSKQKIYTFKIENQPKSFIEWIKKIISHGGGP